MFKCGINCIIEYKAYSFLFVQPAPSPSSITLNTKNYTIDNVGTIRGTVPNAGSTVRLTSGTKTITINILGKRDGGDELIYANTSSVFPIDRTYTPIDGAPTIAGAYPLINYYYRQGNIIQRMVIRQFAALPSIYYAPVGTTLLLPFDKVFSAVYYPNIVLNVPITRAILEIDVSGDNDINIVATISADTVSCGITVRTDGILEKSRDSIVYYGTGALSNLWQSIYPRQMANPTLNVIVPTIPVKNEVISLEASVSNGVYSYRKRDNILILVQKYKFDIICKWGEMPNIDPNTYFYGLATDITTTHTSSAIYYPTVVMYSGNTSVGRINVEVYIRVIDPDPIYITVAADTQFSIKVNPFWTTTNKFALNSGMLEGITPFNATVELSNSSVKQIVYIIVMGSICCNIIRIQETDAHYILDCIIHGRPNSIKFSAIDSKWNGTEFVYRDVELMCADMPSAGGIVLGPFNKTLSIKLGPKMSSPRFFTQAE